MVTAPFQTSRAGHGAFMSGRRRKLGELLVAAGVIDETRLHAALAEQQRWGGRLGRLLVDLGYVREDLLVKALSHQLQLPSINLAKTPPAQGVTQHVSVFLCERYGVFPLGFDPERRAL